MECFDPNELERLFKKADTWGLDPSASVVLRARVGEVAGEYAELFDPENKSPQIIRLVAPDNPGLFKILGRRVDQGKYKGDYPEIYAWGRVAADNLGGVEFRPYMSEDRMALVELRD